MADWSRKPLPQLGRQQPWERQPDETDQAWRCFLAYRDQGWDRSLGRAAADLEVAVSTVQTFSSRFCWRRRCDAYERHLDRKRVEEHVRVVRDMARKHATASQFMLARAIEKLRATPVEEMTVRDAIAMFRAAVPFERMAQALHAGGGPPPGMLAAVDPDEDEEDALP